MSTQSACSSVGIIGYGSMGSAIARAIASSHELEKQFALQVYAKKQQQAAHDGQALFFNQSLQDLVSACDLIIVAVRPEQVSGVVRDVVQGLTDDKAFPRKILISVAAGVTLDTLRSLTGNALAAVRVMPNTLVEAGRGIFGLCSSPDLAKEHKSLILSLLNGIGTVVELEEHHMNAFTALAGCGPGFLFNIMDSLSEAGVSVGLSRESSLSIAKSLMAGCGILAETTRRHPVTLREQGTSPAGMTIAGLNYMDTQGIRGHLIEAVKVACRQGEVMDRESR